MPGFGSRLYRVVTSLTLLTTSCCGALAATCSELEATLTLTGNQFLLTQNTARAYCLSLYPDGYVCGSLNPQFQIESQQSNGNEQRRIRFQVIGPPSTGGIVHISATAWETCSTAAPPVELESNQPIQPGMCTRRPIIPATGEKLYTETDYVSDGYQPLSLVRYFRSYWSTAGSPRPVNSDPFLGQAWSHNHIVSLLLSGAPSTLARVLFGDGSVSSFTRIDAASNWAAANGANTLVPVITGAGGYLLTRADDDSRWLFDTSGRLTTVTQRNGWITTYAYSDATTSTGIAPRPGLLIRVANSFGRSLSFTYNPAGQLTTVTTPEGQTITYAFDGTARLTGVTYPGITARTYLYEDAAWPKSVTGIVDERGIRLATVVYDSQGRGLESGYADGADRYTISYGATPTDPTQVTDPLGTQRSYTYGTALNKLAVTGASLPSGSGGSDAASRVQNTSGLLDSETDFLGVQTMYTWDINRRVPLSTTQAANRPEARTTTTQWHSTFRLPVLVTEPGRSTSYSYDAAGNKLTETVTDATTSQTRAWAWTYNALGLMATSVDPNNRTTTYAYYTDTVMNGVTIDTTISLLLHADGVNGATAFTDNSLSPKTATANGNAQISTVQSRFGGASMAFDGSGDYISIPASSDVDFGAGDFTIELNLYKTANNANTSRIWNPNGDYFDGVSLGIDASGNYAVYLSTNGTSWTHSLPIVANLANNQWYHLAVTRSGGSVFAFVNGVRYTVTTALGNAVLFNQMAYAHVIGGQTGINRALTGYLDELRITKGIARYTANFTPPAVAFANPILVVVNPNDVGHTVGDLQSVTNAAGMVTTFNSYDRAGRVRQSTDAKGVVTDTVYTPRGWISSVTVTPPGLAARTTSYTYDAAGQLTGVANPDGTSQSYSYDAAHRLIGASDNRGNTVTYTLDNMGNRISEQIKDPGGTLQRAISRSFDALNRLQQVSGAVQ